MTAARLRRQQGSGYQTLQDLPGVGPSIAGDYERLGITDPHQLAAADPQDLFDRLELMDGRTDHCVLYVFRCARYAVSTPEPESRLLNWWAWKADADSSATGP